jgi:hypothetical protein
MTVRPASPAMRVDEYGTGSSSDRVRVTPGSCESKRDPVATASGSVFV